MAKSLKINTVFNGINLIAGLLVSVFFSPYINRVLGLTNIGLVNYATNAVNIFIAVAGSALIVIGTREIARNRNDKDKIKHIFSSIMVAQAAVMLISFIPYIIMVFLYPPYAEVRTLLLISIASFILNCFNTDWLFSGLEKFGFIAIRGFILRVLLIACMLIFVKTEADLLIYMTISIASAAGMHIINIIGAVRITGFTLRHIKPVYFVLAAKIFYLQAVIGCVYQFLDKLILGGASIDEVGFYTLARSVASIAITFGSVIPRTIAPRTALLYGNDRDAYNIVVRKAFNWMMYILLPMCLGVFIISDSVIMFMGGDEFVGAVSSLQIVAFLPISTCLSVFVDVNVSIPAGKERNTLISNIIVATACLSLNLILVNKLGAVATSIAILTGESAGVIIMVLLTAKQKILPRLLNLKLLKYAVSSAIMMMALHFISPLIALSLTVKCIVLVTIGASIYFVCNIMLSFVLKQDDEMLSIMKNIFKKIKGKSKQQNENNTDNP